ncbi:MAG: hypothetical protein ACYDCP_05235 [Thermoplasmataceae archaeon]
MNRSRFLSTLLFIDAIVIVTGGYILRTYGLVPLTLTIATYASVVMIVLIGYFVLNGNNKAELTGFILGFVAIAISTNPAHIAALSRFGSTVPLSEADITMVLGFYILPIIYILTYSLQLKRQKF